ncbi:MAG: hypothetical protein QOG48_2501 [Verrucomicrobiota bacterium]|jgi:PKD repeat protein
MKEYRVVSNAVAVLTAAVLLFPTGKSSATPSPPSGTLTPTNKLTYTDGSALVLNQTHLTQGKPNCTGANNCSDFTLTINAASVAATKNILIQSRSATAANDFDIYVEDASGNVVTSNASTVDPSSVILPIPANGTVYHVIVVLADGSAQGFNAGITLIDIPAQQSDAGTPPRYLNFPAASGQATGSGEPSIGVDWKPNVAALKHEKVNSGGVAFFTEGSREWRVNFDDCSSPALNVWENVAAPFTQTFVLSDPIGFVDHYTNLPLGVSAIPPPTTGRVFSLNLIGGQGNSFGSYSDNDGISYLPGGNGGPGAGPDHETLGGGPYHSPAIPQPVAYGPGAGNAIYYCSQNIVAEAQCARSDDGGQTFGPAVPIFTPTQCLGGTTGHVKVAPDGTVYVPNYTCGLSSGRQGVAVSLNNGITWEEFNVPDTGQPKAGILDPSVAVGLNDVGKLPGQTTNTIYLGYIDSDGHAYAATSHDHGQNWINVTDVGAAFNIENGTFPAVVAGDDNRAAFGFLGTTTLGNASTDANFAGVWHLYIATTYDSGAHWVTIDATPDSPVQVGPVCNGGTFCSTPRNLLDFNGFDLDSQGRGLYGLAIGCVRCSNTSSAGSSTSSLGQVTRQSGGRRLFALFDPVEPAAPAAPRVLSSVRGTSGNVLVKWIEPDNGGSPITGYKIYRGTTSGSETFLATVSGATTTKYVDLAAPNSSNWFYRVTAVNTVGEGTFCREVNVNGAQPLESTCVYPYLTVQTDPSGDQTGGGIVNGQEDIQRIAIGEPFTTCADKSLTFILKVQTLSPALPPGANWTISFQTKDTTNTLRTLFVQLDTQTVGTGSFNYGYVDLTTGKTNQCGRPNGLAACPITGSYLPDGTIVMKLDTSAPLKFFGATNVGSTPDFTVNIPAGTALTAITGATQLGSLQNVDTTVAATYTTAGNIACTSSLPIAKLTANPILGAVPLNVTFDASASTVTSPCATLAIYTLNFGDGSPAVTQASPVFSHTYTSPGDYPGRLTVTDSAGQTSTNPAQVVISVIHTDPPTAQVVSRMTHGSAGTFDISLSSTGPRGIECRSGGANGNYQMIFTFGSNLLSVAGATVTAGTGNVSSAAIGPNPNEYTVNLTGVTNAELLTVTLNSVADATGATGNFSATMAVLIGDTTADGFVNSTDIAQTKSQSGQMVSASNFRTDITADGNLNSTDIAVVKSKSGTALPP